ncbi:MAG TPA: metal-dependent hydrolase, partial [Bryobacteraceae bacterium]|nr:metal-dependent hydrolase [Bryobacteraceae bacterium]
MLVGHLGVGLIGKRVEPKISLGTWILAALLADFVCFPLMIAGVESFRHGAGHIPYSHSLLMLAIWAALFGVAFFALRRSRAGALLLACAVLSHWVLDAISHPPDMQLSPGVSAFGLDLWNSVPATLIVEGGFWALAILIYLRMTHA